MDNNSLHFEQTPYHHICLKDRKSLELTGVKKIESEDEYTYTVKMTATYKLDNSILSAAGVAAIMGIALVLLLVVWILFVLRKKKKEDS